MAKKKNNNAEKDSTFLLKILLYFLLGSFWLRIASGENGYVSLPLGLIVGLVFASHEHFQIDRKIEYAILLIATALSAYIPIVGFWV